MQYAALFPGANHLFIYLYIRMEIRILECEASESPGNPWGLFLEFQIPTEASEHPNLLAWKHRQYIDCPSTSTSTNPGMEL
jgi:hypothetical protein